MRYACPACLERRGLYKGIMVKEAVKGLTALPGAARDVRLSFAYLAYFAVPPLRCPNSDPLGAALFPRYGTGDAFGWEERIGLL